MSITCTISGSPSASAASSARPSGRARVGPDHLVARPQLDAGDDVAVGLGDAHALLDRGPAEVLELADEPRDHALDGDVEVGVDARLRLLDDHPAQPGERLRAGRAHVDAGRRAAPQQVACRRRCRSARRRRRRARAGRSARGRRAARRRRRARGPRGPAPTAAICPSSIADVRDPVDARGRAEHVAARDHEVVRHGIRPSSCRRSSERAKRARRELDLVGAVGDREQAAAVEEVHALEQHRALQRAQERLGHAALERDRVVRPLAEDEAERRGLAIGVARRRALLEGRAERRAQLLGDGVRPRQAAAVGQQVERRDAGRGRRADARCACRGARPWTRRRGTRAPPSRPRGPSARRPAGRRRRPWRAP